MDMLTQGKLIICFVFLILIGCAKSMIPYEIDLNSRAYSVKKEVIEAFEMFVDECKYNKISQKYLSIGNSSFIELDSLLLFNSDYSKVFTTLNRIGKYYHTSDGINNIYGIKIDEKWYFILGSHLVLPRRYYQYDSYEPMTFEELSYLAHDMRHKHYLKKGKNGNYMVDHEKIERVVSSKNLIWGEDWVEYYNRKMSDTLTTQEIEQYERNKAKAEAEFVPKQFPKPKKTPIFETEAWKNRNKKKNKK